MKTRTSQAGIVLITSLVVLVILTLIAISTLKTSVLELKIGGAHHISVRNLSNAEAAVQQFMNENRSNYTHEGASFVGTTADYYGDDVTVTPVKVSCHDNCGEGTGNSCGNETLALIFDLEAEAADPVFSGRTVVHQGVTAAVAGNASGC